MLKHRLKSTTIRHQPVHRPLLYTSKYCFTAHDMVLIVFKLISFVYLHDTSINSNAFSLCLPTERKNSRFALWRPRHHVTSTLHQSNNPRMEKKMCLAHFKSSAIIANAHQKIPRPYVHHRQWRSSFINLLLVPPFNHGEIVICTA